MNTYCWIILGPLDEFVWYMCLPESRSKVEKWWLGCLVLIGIDTRVFGWLRCEKDILIEESADDNNKELQFNNDYILMLNSNFLYSLHYFKHYPRVIPPVIQRSCTLHIVTEGEDVFIGPCYIGTSWVSHSQHSLVADPSLTFTHDLWRCERSPSDALPDWRKPDMLVIVQTALSCYNLLGYWYGLNSWDSALVLNHAHLEGMPLLNMTRLLWQFLTLQAREAFLTLHKWEERGS